MVEGGLEAELLEEPAVLARDVTLGEQLLELLAGLALGGGVLDGVLVDHTADAGRLVLGLDVNRVSGGHHVVVVDNLDKRLQGAALLDLLLAHATRDLAGSSVDTSNQCVSVRSLRVTLKRRARRA